MGIFPKKKMLNGLIIDELKEIIKLQDIIKTDELYSKSKKVIILVNILHLLFFERYTGRIFFIKRS